MLFGTKSPSKIFNRRLGGWLLVFISILLVVFGVSSMWMTIWPVVASSMAEPEPYFPPLPASADREADLSEVDKVPPKQIFPALGNIEEVEDGNWLRIPSIGVKVPMVLSATMDDADILATLDKGAALYPNGITPGHMGNTFIAAHSTGEPWKGAYRFAFLRINELTDNNLIHLDYQNTRYTYRIISKDIVKPSKDLKIRSEGFTPTVTLMACWPLWSTESRMLIKGELTNISKLTVAPS